MCGFAGLIDPAEQDAGRRAELAERMSACIAHRGPDDHGSWSDPQGPAALAFRRLSIIDLSAAGHQPMRSASGRFWMVFNGEVYNHSEIRGELGEGDAHYRGHSDTEVILAAFERWGIEASVRRFVGMFAIAVWDMERRRLTLIRDRLGIKPLYYAQVQGRVLFGSELKALMAHPAFDRSLDADALADYLRYLYVPAPRTIFRDARKLPPGSTCTFDDTGRLVAGPEPYWSLDDVARQGLAAPFAGSDEEATDQLEALLGDAVRLRMRADVPMGALLSGGVDSSVVVALMQRGATAPVRTFSIAFPGTEHDESAHAAAVARHLGTDHTEMAVGGDEALAVVPDLPVLFDEPLADPSQIPTFLVSRLARRDVTVALSGDGGDELFAGYERYTKGERVIARAARAPRLARTAAAAALSSAGAGFWDGAYRAVAPMLGRGEQRLVGQKARKLAELLRQDGRAAMYRSLLSTMQRPEELLSSPRRQWGPIEERLEAYRALPLLDMMQLLDQHNYLADDLLAKVDRASMAVGLEARVPILDHRVVEFSWRLPRHLRVRGGRGKWLLREVLYRHVPSSLVDRPKTGFSVPLARWLRGPLRVWAQDTLLSADRGRAGEWLDGAAVSKVWRRFDGGDDGLALPVWTLLMFEAWRARWVS